MSLAVSSAGVMLLSSFSAEGTEHPQETMRGADLGHVAIGIQGRGLVRRNHVTTGPLLVVSFGAVMITALLFRRRFGIKVTDPECWTFAVNRILGHERSLRLVGPEDCG